MVIISVNSIIKNSDALSNIKEILIGRLRDILSTIGDLKGIKVKAYINREKLIPKERYFRYFLENGVKKDAKMGKITKYTILIFPLLTHSSHLLSYYL